VVLVYPETDLLWGSFVPLGLCQLGTHLETGGIRVEVVDRRWHTDEYLALKVKEADIVGFTTTTLYVDEIFRLAALCKGINREVKVVLGGPHPSVAPTECLSNASVDFVVFGEGEVTMLELARGKALEGIRGLAYKLDDGVRVNKPRPPIEDLDQIPIADRDLFPLQRMLRLPPFSIPIAPYPYTNMISSRGCPYNCLFCQPTLRTLFGGVVHRRSPEKVVDEFQYLREKHGVKCISMQDDLFLQNKKWISAVCGELRRRGIHDEVVWDCQSRADTFDEETAKEIKKSGCYLVFFGIESFSQSVLDRLRKGTTVQQNIDALRLCKRLGLVAVSQIMIGNPFETEMDVLTTAKHLLEVDPDIIWIANTTPMPGTDLYEYCRAHRLLISEKMGNIGIRAFTGKPKIHLSYSIELIDKVVRERQRTGIDPKLLLHSYYRAACVRRFKCHIEHRNVQALFADLAYTEPVRRLGRKLLSHREVADAERKLHERLFGKRRKK